MEVRLQHRHLFATVKPEKERSNTETEHQLEVFEKQRTGLGGVEFLERTEMFGFFLGPENSTYRTTGKRHTYSADKASPKARSRVQESQLSQSGQSYYPG